MTDRPTIFIAMPLFEGWEHVAQTLESIEQQTYRDFRVLISVDGGDLRSYEACQPFLSDPRFEIVLHQERLGWDGNMNYLASRFTGDFFCYWQHDDFCKPSYLEALVAHAVAHPEASAIYCDMQIFGETERIVRRLSVTGFALERVLLQVDQPAVVAIRCLIRADALRASMPIKYAATWVLPLARMGEFHRVPELLYFRRIRKEALTFTMSQLPPLVLWRGSLDWVLAVLENVHPLICAEEQTKLFTMIVDLIAKNKIKGITKYNFIGTSHDLKVKFVRQFLDEAKSAHGWRPYPNIADDDLEQALREKIRTQEKLPDGETLLINAILAPDILPDDAVVTDYVPATVDGKEPRIA